MKQRPTSLAHIDCWPVLGRVRYSWQSEPQYNEIQHSHLPAPFTSLIFDATFYVHALEGSLALRILNIRVSIHEVLL